MPVSIVVGGQYGSEGKGKVAHFLVGLLGASVAIRTGGPNSGHTLTVRREVMIRIASRRTFRVGLHQNADDS